MSDLQYDCSTDSEHVIKLESQLVAAVWLSATAPAGRAVCFEVLTALVGEGAKIKVTGTSENGARLGQVSGKVYCNRFSGEFSVPDDARLGDKVYFTVSLPDNGLEAESGRISVVPPIRVAGMRWSSDQVRRGDIVTMSADITGLPNGSEIEFVLLEHSSRGAHERVAVIPANVSNDRVEAQWEFEYHSNTNDIPTQAELEPYGGSYSPPRYFFVIRADGQDFGREQESGLLEFRDVINMEFADPDGSPLADEDYAITLPDGTQREGKLDSQGRLHIDDAPPGPVVVSLPAVADRGGDDSDSDPDSNSDSESDSDYDSDYDSGTESGSNPSSDLGTETQSETESDDSQAASP
jgi:hypothetical protein